MSLFSAGVLQRLAQRRILFGETLQLVGRFFLLFLDLLRLVLDRRIAHRVFRGQLRGLIRQRFFLVGQLRQVGLGQRRLSQLFVLPLHLVQTRQGRIQ